MNHNARPRRGVAPAACALTALALANGLPAASWARPITYPGGTSIMAMHDPAMSMTGFDYTLNREWALGAAIIYDREDELTLAGPTVTRGWRWNWPDSQANVYASGAAGVATGDGATRPAAWSALSADWEDRRYYVQAGTSVQAIADGPDRLRNTARVGVAPYIAESGGLHSWLMLQADHTPGTRQAWSVTPLLRQFRGSHLWEVGVNSRGGVLLNYTHSF